MVGEGEVECFVRDNGPGIPGDDLTHIFERFYRVEKGRSRETGGTGLGLSIVKHIVQLHGGRVWAESKEGQGLTIRVRLPRTRAENPELRGCTAPAGSRQLGAWISLREFIELIARRRADLRAELGAILPQPRPIVLEIGCGHGHFLARYAADFTAKTCVGVDLSSDRIARAKRKSGRARLPNCHFVRADARDFLSALPAGVTFGEIWLLFPDPWPKKRHHKNRLLQPGLP